MQLVFFLTKFTYPLSDKVIDQMMEAYILYPYHLFTQMYKSVALKYKKNPSIDIPFIHRLLILNAICNIPKEGIWLGGVYQNESFLLHDVVINGMTIWL